MRNSVCDNKALVLKRDAKKWISFWLTGIVFLVATQLVGGGMWWYWPSIVLWFAGFLFATVQLIPGSASLKLDRTGITITKLFKKRFVSWDDCSEFKVWTYEYTSYWPFTFKQSGVVFSSGRSGWLVEMNKKHTGEDDFLPGTYGLDAEGLCSLLDEWHQTSRSATSSGTDSSKL